MTVRINHSANIERTSFEEIGSQEQNNTPNTLMPEPTTDEAKKQNEAKTKLSSDIKSGKAELVKTGIIENLIGLVLNQNKRTGDYIKITNIEKGTLYSDIIKKYNLPAGSLNHMVSGGIGNNKNNYGYVTIYIEDLTTALNLNEKQIKKLFE